jgi:hypothetical protein
MGVSTGRLSDRGFEPKLRAATGLVAVSTVVVRAQAGVGQRVHNAGKSQRCLRGSGDLGRIASYDWRIATKNISRLHKRPKGPMVQGLLETTVFGTFTSSTDLKAM